MESKKKPLWLTMNTTNANESIVLMLKVGDDLRQDALILQLLRVMDDIWRKEGLEMQMMLYDCISTGFERGLLQVVLNATTLARILMESTNKNHSGKLSRKFGSAFKALRDFDVLREWIWEQVSVYSIYLACVDAHFNRSMRYTNTYICLYYITRFAMIFQSPTKQEDKRSFKGIIYHHL
jgi:hypothetical protein